jgi:hypothetical protein
MKLPYETSTAGSRALDQLQKTLDKFGCQSFGVMTDNERGLTIVQFKWRDRAVSLEASWKGYAQAWVKEHPGNFGSWQQEARKKHEAKATAIAQVAVCSVLRDWVKGQVTAIECGVLSFEAAFMPHLLLKNGMRVIDKIRSDNLLPAPADEKVVALK